jgi:tRNA (guanine37-N1)-methyltransferase
MKIDTLTIFPDIFTSYLNETFIKRAQEKKLIEINVHNLRKWTTDEHKSVDDRPFGGGLGMVLMVDPIYKAIKELKKKNTRVVVFSPRGRKYNQKKCTDFSKEKHIILICGRYEGIDERVLKYLADDVISIGNYDLMGGELPAMIVIESITRLIPNVLGKKEFLEERKTKDGGFIEYPQYTRSELFGDKKVPRILLSGNHKEIKVWREKHKKVIEK